MSILQSIYNHKLYPFLQVALRVILGGVFLQSGLAKLSALPEFYLAAQNYQFLTPMLTHLYAVMLPWLEIIAGLYLLLGLFVRFSALLTSGMLLSFVIAIGWVLWKGIEVDCGCFIGGRQDPVDAALLLRDIAMLIGALYLTGAKSFPWSVDNWLNAPAND